MVADHVYHRVFHIIRDIPPLIVAFLETSAHHTSRRLGDPGCGLPIPSPFASLVASCRATRRSSCSLEQTRGARCGRRESGAKRPARGSPTDRVLEREQAHVEEGHSRSYRTRCLPMCDAASGRYRWCALCAFLFAMPRTVLRSNEPLVRPCALHASWSIQRYLLVRCVRSLWDSPLRMHHRMPVLHRYL